MRSFWLAFRACLLCAFTLAAAQQPGAPPSPSQSPASKNSDADAQLRKALSDAGNDAAAVVRNLKDYLQRFPDSPRTADIDRAIVEACRQLRDNPCALDYAERLIAIRPADSDMMMLAITLLQQQGDDASLTRASGYATRVLDRVEKTPESEKPPRQSPADWQKRHDELRAAIYCVRGQIEIAQRSYDAAAQDLHTSYSLLPTALAAEQLGEIAETRKDLPTAIEEYSLAFALPDSGLAGSPDRRTVRRKLGNVWRQAHGSEQGLGDEILAVYDRTAPAPANADADASLRNRDAKTLSAFVLRHLDGSPLPLATLQGKVVALSFWATWCGPCRDLEPKFDELSKGYAGNASVVFLDVNSDEDQTLVPPFLAREKWTGTVVYADGLQNFLDVKYLPTVIVMDRDGKIVYRVSGPPADEITASLNAAIQRALIAAP